MFLESDKKNQGYIRSSDTCWHVSDQHMDLPDARTQGLMVAAGQQDIAWSMA